MCHNSYMLTILLHSSKTMRHFQGSENSNIQEPSLTPKANKIAAYLKSLTPAQLQKTMSISPAKAKEVHELLANYSRNHPTLPALDLFLGDIYSGLQAQSLTLEDRDYANNHLFILSGLYGLLRPMDLIQPHRLEMGTRLASARISNSRISKPAMMVLPAPGSSAST